MPNPADQVKRGHGVRPSPPKMERRVTQYYSEIELPLTAESEVEVILPFYFVLQSSFKKASVIYSHLLPNVKA